MNGHTEKWWEAAAAKDKKTDYSRWRLHIEDGRQRWMYLTTQEEIDAWPQSTADKFHLGLDTQQPALPHPKTYLDVAANGLTYFEKLQLEEGNWACEYGGPMFLLPGFVITWTVTETKIPEHFKIEIKNYLFARQNKQDGGWGLHIEGESTVFGTAMNYTCLRLIGAEPDDVRMVKARECLHALGGALNGPHWAKAWLAILGVVSWDVVNPVPPELWLLPDWVPIAPWRWWIHMRQVFLPMGYIYSRRFSYPLTPTTRALQNELFTQPHASIKWAQHRNDVHPRDNYYPKTQLLSAVNWVIVNFYNPIFHPLTKKWAEDWSYELIQRENENTNYACLGPVNAPMNMIACMLREGKDSEPVQKLGARLHDFLWMKNEGMLANGTNGVQVWDTSFAIQAVVSCGLADSPRWKPMLIKALEFLDKQQIREEARDMDLCYRHTRKGAWGFSTRDQGYTVSDTTSEAAKAVLLLQTIPGYPQLLAPERIKQAIDVVLTMQNSTGGFASYEQRRGNATLMEAFNAAEVFGNIMVEYDYPECTTAVVTFLSMFRKHDPTYRAADISRVLDGALKFIRNDQRPDGSWYGSWAICFTYATMFALESLFSVGETHENSERVRRACAFLLSKQNRDGGWGESYRSCEIHEYVDHPDGSQVVNTAWACIALMEAQYPNDEPIVRGLELIKKRQQPNGEWLQEGIEGVFNKTCMISYPNYKFAFPIKALGMYEMRKAGKLVH